jgi:multidrug transporter EmrE-like cation transporter
VRFKIDCSIFGEGKTRALMALYRFYIAAAATDTKAIGTACISFFGSTKMVKLIQKQASATTNFMNQHRFYGSVPRGRAQKETTMNTLILIGAAVSYSLGGYYMKLSQGLTKAGATGAVMALFCLGACLQMYAMRQSEMTSNYIIVLGLEAITALSIGIFFLNEGITWPKLIGVCIVVVGVAFLRN